MKRSADALGDELLRPATLPFKKQRETRPILELMDFSGLTQQAEIQARFSELAEHLLVDHGLYIKHGGGTASYQLLEVEFYLNSSNIHPDPYCHSAREQRHPGNW